MRPVFGFTTRTPDGMVHPCDGIMSKWLEFFRKLAGKPARKTVLWAAALLTLALVAAGLYWGGQRAEEKQPVLKIIDDNVDLYIKDVHYTEVGDSGNRLEINADSATFLKKENQARFDRVRMKLILPDGKTYELTADRGHLRTDLKDAETRGQRGDPVEPGRPVHDGPAEILRRREEDLYGGSRHAFQPAIRDEGQRDGPPAEIRARDDDRRHSGPDPMTRRGRKEPKVCKNSSRS